nr:DUF262 domain-containing HNH endonuclease family protein [Carnobacterium maltaromaticum]
MIRNDIKPDIQTITAYFERKEFYIPSYQRPYAWQVTHCEQLIEDIETHKESFDLKIQDNYFFGAILIAQETGEEYETTLIDGQQRTTSFMLLLKAILIKIKKELGFLSEDSSDDEKLIEKLTGLQNDIISMLYTLDEDSSFYYKRNKYQLKDHDIKYLNDSISETYRKDMTTILINENFDAIKNSVIKIRRRQQDNKYTNFYKNFRYFHKYCDKLTNTQIRDFSEHFLKYCQIITITSYNTDQAINIFNSLNGTGVPLTPIEVIVSKATAKAIDRKGFEQNWQKIVEKTDRSSLNLNLLMTHFIFTKLSEQHGTVTRNPGIRAFFAQNKKFLNNDILFTNHLDRILDIVNGFDNTEVGKILNKFNGNIKPFVSSYLFFREGHDYLTYLLRLAAVLELTDFSYGNANFKGFLERINLKYSQVDQYSEQDLITEIKMHISKNFNREDIEQTLKESGVSNSIIFLNEYIYSKEHNLEFSAIGNIDIEHIMPQSGLNRENIMKDAGFEYKDEFFEYAEKIGNKILLESEINRGIGDAWFRTKKENTITSHHGYKGSKYKIASALVNYHKDIWTREDIDWATDKAANRIASFIFE